MSAKTVEIQVQNDHLARLAQVRKPILAVAELIWNAVDADADRVDVSLHDDVLGELTAIEVSDDGHGMPYSEAENLFSRLGGSWKRGGKRSRTKKRLLHGQYGGGRFASSRRSLTMPLIVMPRSPILGPHMTGTLRTFSLQARLATMPLNMQGPPAKPSWSRRHTQRGLPVPDSPKSISDSGR